MMEAALAALLLCLCDPGGPFRCRLPAILTFGVLAERLRAAISRAAPESWQADAPGPEPSRLIWGRLASALWDNLSWQSKALRHALRAAATAAPAFAFTL